MSEIGWECVNFMCLHQDGDKWRTLVKKVTKFGFQKKGREFLGYLNKN